jgi:DNA-binding transcriptional regulator/RsmH inhibitor MraZ
VCDVIGLEDRSHAWTNAHFQAQQQQQQQQRGTTKINL